MKAFATRYSRCHKCDENMVLSLMNCDIQICQKLEKCLAGYHYEERFKFIGVPL